MAPLDVLGVTVVLWIVSQIAPSLVVHGEAHGRVVLYAQLVEVVAQKGSLLGTASDAAISSASQDDNTTEGCRLLAHDIAAWLSLKTS